jgi:hypothetical protein
MGSSNPVKKVVDPLEKLGQQVADNTESLSNDPGQAVKYGAAYGIAQAPGAAAIATGDTYNRIKNDQIDQAERQALGDQQRAAQADAAAADAAPKSVEELALERRKRASIQSKAGRAGTDLTGGNSLGSVDVVRKMLLGM